MEADAQVSAFFFCAYVWHCDSTLIRRCLPAACLGRGSCVLLCGMATSRKSKVSIFLVLGGIGALVYFWLRSQLNLISFGGLSIPFQQLKDGRINLGLRLPIINASALGARVTGFTGFIKSPSGATVGTVFLAAPVSIPAYQQSELLFKSSIALSDIVSEAGGLILGGQLPNNWGEVTQYLKQYRLIGQLRVFGLPLPIEMPLL